MTLNRIDWLLKQLLNPDTDQPKEPPKVWQQWLLRAKAWSEVELAPESFRVGMACGMAHTLDYMRTIGLEEAVAHVQNVMAAENDLKARREAAEEEGAGEEGDDDQPE